MSESTPFHDSGSPDDELDAEGIPEMTDRSAAGPDDPERSPDVGEESPIGVTEFGITEAEEEQGEPLDGRLARELPDVGEAGAPERTEPDLTGRLVAEGTPGPDTGTDAAADALVEDSGGFTAEESAVHAVTPPDNQ